MAGQGHCCEKFVDLYTFSSKLKIKKENMKDSACLRIKFNFPCWAPRRDPLAQINKKNC